MNGEVTTRDAQWVTVIEDMKTGDIHEDSNILIYLRTLLHLCLRLDATIPPRFCFETSDSVDYLVGYETLLRLCMIIGLAKGLLDWEYNTLWKRLCWLNLRCKTTRMTTPRTTMSHGKKRTDIADLSSLLNKKPAPSANQHINPQSKQIAQSSHSGGYVNTTILDTRPSSGSTVLCPASHTVTHPYARSTCACAGVFCSGS